MIEPIAPIWSLEQAKQIGAAKHAETCPFQRKIQPLSIRHEALPRRGNPLRVAQGQGSDLASWTGYRPVAQRMMPGRSIGLSDNHKTHTQSGETEVLAERSQHHDACR